MCGTRWVVAAAAERSAAEVRRRKGRRRERRKGKGERRKEKGERRKEREERRKGARLRRRGLAILIVKTCQTRSRKARELKFPSATTSTRTPLSELRANSKDSVKATPITPRRLAPNPHQVETLLDTQSNSNSANGTFEVQSLSYSK
ncbi:hypothetical protein Droror1_Dr00003252 [Drosera rotundifolia]